MKLVTTLSGTSRFVVPDRGDIHINAVELLESLSQKRLPAFELCDDVYDAQITSAKIRTRL
jgi:hypothetical protein